MDRHTRMELWKCRKEVFYCHLNSDFLQMLFIVTAYATEWMSLIDFNIMGYVTLTDL
jgi:hypothetical protein